MPGCCPTVAHGAAPRRAGPPGARRPSPRGARAGRLLPPARAAAPEAAPAPASALGPAERYVATNRFQTKTPEASAAFEKRWATRKSRLATLEGFKWFALLRQVAKDGSGPLDPAGLGGEEFNYSSFTVWNDKANFDAWRKGEAFKEAHGGGTIFGFVDMLVNSAKTLRGPPKPLFYNATSVASAPYAAADLPRITGGWRDVAADGVNLLDTECFAAIKTLYVKAGTEQAFVAATEAMLAKAEGAAGFRFGALMQPDNEVPAEGELVIATVSIWDSKAEWEAFLEANRAAIDERKGEGAGGVEWTKPPVGRHYEGTLLLTTTEGA